MSTTEPTNEAASTEEVEAATIEAPEAEETAVAVEAEAPVEVAEEAAEPAAEPAAEAPAEPAAEVATEPAAAPTPAAVPKPSAPAVPKPTPRPQAAPAAANKGAEWGRVSDAGVVEVREGDTWRVVGEYTDGTPAEALAYFARKFDDIEFKVRNLEQRKRGGGAAAGDLAQQAAGLLGEIEGAAVVGDLIGLAGRVNALTESLSQQTAEEAEAQRKAIDEAVAARTVVVEKAEALAARNPKNIQWKQASAELTALFDEWQLQQQTGPRLPKNLANDLWKRFRTARSTIEKHRREFYAQLDETHKGARTAKQKLVERAEALASRGEEGIPAYRTLLDEWKATGRAGRKVDDALWARFKAAGDALYSARSERDAAEQAESLPRIEERKALLVEAAAVADESDLRKARQLLTSIQRKWDEVGRIFPRDRERQLDDEMRKIETALRTREDVDWKKNNPETQARADGMSRQLLDAIEKLESELEAAKKAGNAKAIKDAEEALEARRAWLKALGA